MKFLESGNVMEREIIIAKSRASAHDKEVKRYIIDSKGLCILDDGAKCESRTRKKRRTRPKKRAPGKRKRK